MLHSKRTASRWHLLRVLCQQVPLNTTRQAYKDFLATLPALHSKPPAAQAAMHHPGHYADVWGFLIHVYRGITNSSLLLPCNHTVNRVEHFDPEAVAPYKYAFAANFHNSETTLPNLIHQVLQLVLYLPAGHSLITIYESGSDDNTKAWLQTLQMLLMPLGVPHHIVSGGNLKRKPGQVRVVKSQVHGNIFRE